MMTQHETSTLPQIGYDRARLEADMRACEQARGQSVLEHGEGVAATFLTLVRHIRDGGDAPSWWRIPEWAQDPALLDRLPPMETMLEYLTWHDCGKPFCLEVDSEGRRRFPGHAAMSEKVWLAIGGDPLAARLMGMDMDAHLLRPEGIEEFASRPEAPALLLAALAEVHANAELFGGHDSDSFKAKAKHLAKRGRQVLSAAPAPGMKPWRRLN